MIASHPLGIKRFVCCESKIMSTTVLWKYWKFHKVRMVLLLLLFTWTASIHPIQSENWYTLVSSPNLDLTTHFALLLIYLWLQLCFLYTERPDSIVSKMTNSGFRWTGFKSLLHQDVYLWPWWSNYYWTSLPAINKCKTATTYMRHFLSYWTTDCTWLWSLREGKHTRWNSHLLQLSSHGKCIHIIAERIGWSKSRAQGCPLAKD